MPIAKRLQMFPYTREYVRAIKSCRASHPDIQPIQFRPNCAKEEKGGIFWEEKKKSPHLGASVVLSPHPSAAPSGSGGLGEGSGSGCRTGEDAALGGGAPPPSLALADLEMWVATGIPMASDAEERPRCWGGEEEEDLSETSSSSMPRSPSSTSTLSTSTWRSFRCRVSLGGARRSRLPAPAPWPWP